MSKTPTPLKIEQGRPYLLDQRRLPQQEVYLELKSLEDGHRFIADMVVRGAPLIGFTALWTMVVWLRRSLSTELEDFKKASDWLATARPTAVNLRYELDEALRFLEPHYNSQASFEKLVDLLESFTQSRVEALEADNTLMAQAAYQELIEITGRDQDFRLMTICNTGYLACGTTGTAFGVISYLNERGLLDEVFACETRPYLQGARLTTYELDKLGIKHNLIVEGAMSYVLERERVDAIFVGADRIVGNGDTANKIGTSSLAIIAKHYGIPFYVVAPTSSFDMSLENGKLIEIEMRPQEEITHWKGELTCSASSKGYNPSFDVTDHQLIRGIFCEKGLIRPSDGPESLAAIVSSGR